VLVGHSTQIQSETLFRVFGGKSSFSLNLRKSAEIYILPGGTTDCNSTESHTADSESVSSSDSAAGQQGRREFSQQAASVRLSAGIFEETSNI